jgi:hypothetical protein
MKKCDDSADKAESAELVFPDWSGMDESSSRVAPDAAFQLCERYRSWFPQLSEEWRAQRPGKCLVEFVL